MFALFQWKIPRRWRVLSIIGIATLLAVQLTREALWAATTVSLTTAEGPFWIFYTAYGVIAVLFLGVGALAWLYGFRRQPVVSALLFAFCSVMMITFGTLSAPAVGDTFSVAVGSSCSALAVLFLLLLLLRFPYDIYAHMKVQRGQFRALLSCLGALTALCLFSVIRNVRFNYYHVAGPEWLTLLEELYFVLAGTACIWAVIYAIRHASSVRSQQQTRLFFAGTLLSFVPILVLTVIPTTLHLRTAVDGTLSMLFLVFFPLSLGYALLRYQVLVFDSYVKKTVTRIVGGVSLALLAYALFAAGSLLVAERVSFLLACLIAVGVVGAPLLWWGASWLTGRYFFPEVRYYERLLKQAQHSQMRETFNLQLIAQSLTLDAMATLKAPEACLFFLDEETQSYSLVAPYRGHERQERLRVHLLDPLEASLSHNDGRTAIAVASPLPAALTQARRPLFLSEALSATTNEQRGGLSRYLSPPTSQQLSSGLLLAPVHTLQGVLIGVLAVAERGDQEHYAGPELEALQKMVRSATAALETARLYEVATRQQQRSALEVAQAYEQQRQLNAIKDELIIHMSHELRTPLTEVSGYLELLSEHGQMLDATMQALFVQKANHGCLELLELVNTILEAAQAGALVAPPACEAVSLVEVVSTEIDNLDPTTTGSHRLLRQGIDEVFVWANEQTLRQVVRNLLSNALKYSPNDSTVTVSATEDEEGVCLRVKDEGPGIPPAEMPLLFGKFVRLQRDMSGAIRGTGLGLYISRQMVEAMGGSIWAESSGIQGEGSCFSIRLSSARARASAPGTAVHDLARV